MRLIVSLTLLLCFLSTENDTLTAPINRLDTTAIPIQQFIYLTVNADSSHFSGSTNIDLQINQSIRSFEFHAEDMVLDSHFLSDGNNRISCTAEVGELGLTTLTAEKELKAGVYTLSIWFTAPFNTRAVGLYKVVTEGAAYTFTQFQEIDARKAFPCWDEPNVKIPYQMTLTVPREHLAVSNTSIEKETTEGEWRTVTFRKTRPLPSYLLAIATGPLETVDIPNMPIPSRVVFTRGKKHLTGLAIQYAPPFMDALVEYFGRPYPYDKLDLIAVPEFWAGAMENAGAITYRETSLLIDSANATVSQLRVLCGHTAHEFAHMWFGDLVTMEWWDDLWLNESFATWMGNKISEQVFPGLAIQLSELGDINRAMSGDAMLTTQPIRQPTRSSDNLLSNIGVVYNKGNAVLSMFEEWMGAEVFRKGIQTYLKRHEWRNATADDLWKALGEASGMDIASVMNDFIVQPGVPLVTVVPQANGVVTISQRRFTNFGDSLPPDVDQVWSIPLKLKFGNGRSVRTHHHLLTKAEETITLPGEETPKWIMPMADASGYYRWLTPGTILNELASAGTELTVRDKMAYLYNLEALLDAGEIGGDTYMKALAGFSQEVSPSVIAVVVSGVSSARDNFISDDLSTSFSIYVRKVLRPILTRWGLRTIDGEDATVSSTRPRVFSLLAHDGQETELIAAADSMAKQYFRAPESTDVTMLSNVLSLSAIQGNEELYELYQNRFETAKLPADRGRFLSALGSFYDSALTQRALEYSLHGPLRPQERGVIPRSIAGRSEKAADMIFDWMMANFDEIIANATPNTKAFMTSYASGCSTARLAKAREFFAEPQNRTEGTELRLERVTEQVEHCVGLREREGEAVRKYLAEVANGN